MLHIEHNILHCKLLSEQMFINNLKPPPLSLPPVHLKLLSFVVVSLCNPSFIEADLSLQVDYHVPLLLCNSFEYWQGIMSLNLTIAIIVTCMIVIVVIINISGWYSHNQWDMKPANATRINICQCHLILPLFHWSSCALCLVHAGDEDRGGITTILAIIPPLLSLVHAWGSQIAIVATCPQHHACACPLMSNFCMNCHSLNRPIIRRSTMPLTTFKWC